MNPNDLLAQEQAVINQATRMYWRAMAPYFVIEIAVFVVGCWVIYMFYARLGNILDEVRKLRIAHEFAQDHDDRAKSDYNRPSAGSLSVPQTSKLADAKYMPKS